MIGSVRTTIPGCQNGIRQALKWGGIKACEEGRGEADRNFFEPPPAMVPSLRNDHQMWVFVVRKLPDLIKNSNEIIAESERSGYRVIESTQSAQLLIRPLFPEAAKAVLGYVHHNTPNSRYGYVVQCS